MGGAFDGASDPAVAVGPDGAVDAQTLVLDADGCHSGVAVQRSDDGRLTFGALILVQDDRSSS